MPPTLIAVRVSISLRKTTPEWLYKVPLSFLLTQVSLLCGTGPRAGTLCFGTPRPCPAGLGAARVPAPLAPAPRVGRQGRGRRRYRPRAQGWAPVPESVASRHPMTLASGCRSPRCTGECQKQKELSRPVGAMPGTESKLT